MNPSLLVLLLAAPPTDDDLTFLDFVDPSTYAVDSSMFRLVVGGSLALGLYLLFTIGRRIRRLVVAERAEQRLLDGASAPLAAGAERAIRGTVAFSGPGDIAVDVRITQTVSNGKATHHWEETSRKVVSYPFFLVTPEGESVCVVPGENVLVADRLVTEIEEGNWTTRVRKCDVRNGEVFTAYGDLDTGTWPTESSAYRGNEQTRGWLLTPSLKTGRLLLAVDPPRDRYRPRITYMTRYGLGFALAWVLYVLCAVGPGLITEFIGTRTQAAVVNLDTYVTKRSKSNVRDTHFRIAARTEDGTLIESELPQPTYDFLDARRRTKAEALRIPMLRGPKLCPSYLGTRASPPLAWVAFPLIAFIILMLFVGGNYGDRVAWYDRKGKLSEPGAPGRWPPG